MNAMDRVAKRLGDKMAELQGQYTHTPYPTWDEATEGQKEWLRELARVSQEPTEDDRKKAEEAFDKVKPASTKPAPSPSAKSDKPATPSDARRSRAPKARK